MDGAVVAGLCLAGVGGAWLLTHMLGMTAVSNRGAASIFSVVVVLAGRFGGWRAGVLSAACASIVFDFCYASASDQLFSETNPAFFLVYTQWMFVAVIAAPDAFGPAAGRMFAIRTVAHPRAEDLIHRIRSGDAPYLLPWHVRDTLGRQLTRDEIEFWTDIARAVGTSDRRHLLSLVDKDSDDLDARSSAVE